MKKILPYTIACGILLGGGASSLSSLSEATAATSYKVLKNKLVNSKTGKIVKGTVLYKKKLYTNGKLTTKTTLYKKQLFQKGKLATGKVVYKNTLFVSGKIKSSIVKHNNQFYKKGKKVASNYTFEYYGELFTGSKLSRGYKIYKNELFYNGAIFSGVKDNTYYAYGVKQDHFQHDVFYSEDGTAISVHITMPDSDKVKFNVKNMTVDNGAIITSSKLTNDYLDNEVIIIELGNTKLNENYSIQLKNLAFGKSETFTHTENISGLTTNLQEDKTYIQLLKYYNKYKNYSAEQIFEAPSKDKDFQKTVDLIVPIRDAGHRVIQFDTAENRAKYSLANYLYIKLDVLNYMLPELW